jgi:type I restriction enzyme S subunit
MSVPVPPTDIQDAIIEILENFMSLESLLTNELELRRQQLQYYRSSLLDHPEEI